MQISFFFLGMVLDDTAMLIIVAPLYIPLVSKLGFDLRWFGVLYVLNCQMAFITPPFGYNLIHNEGNCTERNYHDRYLSICYSLRCNSKNGTGSCYGIPSNCDVLADFKIWLIKNYFFGLMYKRCATNSGKNGK